MKLLIAADMEGISGVVHWDQVTAAHSEYPRFRRIMTEEVNAAVRGAFDGGATHVQVADGHGSGRNILIEELDRRVRLNSGSQAPYAMVQGIETGADGVFFIGYHARMGTPNAILDHTWSDERVSNLWINDRLFGESGLNGALCGHFGAPVIMVSGDQAVCAEAREMFGEVETAVVKTAAGRMAADCLSPEAARQAIYDAVLRAMIRLAASQAPPPLRLAAPIRMAVEFVQSDMADRAMLLPGARRGEGRCVEYTSSDMPAIYAAFRTMLALAR
jgi:D-amino peptidase